VDERREIGVVRFVAAALAVSVLAGCGAPRPTSSYPSEIADYGSAPALRLPNVDGGRFALDAPPRMTTVLTFVTADCREICPKVENVLLQVARTFHRNGQLGRDIRIVTVEIDPLRNSRKDVQRLRLRLWAQNGWFFLRGSASETRTILRRYDIAIKPRAIGKDLEHAVWVFVIDKRLRERYLLAPGVNLTPAELERDIARAAASEARRLDRPS